MCAVKDIPASTSPSCVVPLRLAYPACAACRWSCAIRPNLAYIFRDLLQPKHTCYEDMTEVLHFSAFHLREKCGEGDDSVVWKAVRRADALWCTMKIMRYDSLMSTLSPFLFNPAHIHSYIHTFIHSYIHTFIHSYIHTFIHSYIHTFILSYNHTIIQSCSFLLSSPISSPPIHGYYVYMGITTNNSNILQYFINARGRRDERYIMVTVNQGTSDRINTQGGSSPFHLQ